MSLSRRRRLDGYPHLFRPKHMALQSMSDNPPSASPDSIIPDRRYHGGGRGIPPVHTHSNHRDGAQDLTFCWNRGGKEQQCKQKNRFIQKELGHGRVVLSYVPVWGLEDMVFGMLIGSTETAFQARFSRSWQ
eukprot:747462-Hanusia_phi.AAC.2